MSKLIEPSLRAGKFLIRFAWAVEICAASVGLLFAWLILFSKSADLQNTDNQIRLFVAAIPFVIVAIVELTKIPLASACYFSTTRLHKYVFAVSLLLVSFITFETFLNGFQQGLQIRLAPLRIIQKDNKQTATQLKNITEEKLALDGLSLQEIERVARDEIMDLNKREKQEIEFKQELMDKERNRLGGPQQESLQRELTDMKAESKEMAERYASMIKEVEKRYEEQVSVLQEDTKNKKEHLSTQASSVETEIKDTAENIKNNKSEIKSIRNAGTFGNKREKIIRDKYADKRDNIKESIASDKTSIEERSEELTAEVKNLKTELDGTLTGSFLNPELAEKISKKESELEGLSIRRMNLNIKSQLKEIDDEEKKEIKDLREEIKTENSKRIEELQADIRQHAETLVKLKIRKEGLVQKSSDTTIGSQRANFLDKKTKEIRLLSNELTEQQQRKAELIEEKQAKLSQVLGLSQIELYPKQEAHKEEVENIIKKYEIKKEAVEKLKKKGIGDFDRRDTRIIEINNEVPILQNKLSEYATQLQEEGEKSIVGQWSLLIFRNAEEKNVNRVALVWFGSLAAITAWLGTLLAFASLVLRYGHLKEHKSSGISRAIQRYFAVARKWKRKPKIKEIEIEVEKIVEVIKEVPVTKVVTQEVPKEVIRKQIVHVPIASDDLTILDFNEKLSNQSKKDNKDTDDKDTSNSKT